MPSKLLLRNFEAGGYYHLQHNAKSGTELFKTDLDYQNFLLLLSYYLRFPSATPLSWIKRLTPQTVIAKRDASEFGKTPSLLWPSSSSPTVFTSSYAKTSVAQGRASPTSCDA